MTDTQHLMREALQEYLWDQWVALGIAGHSRDIPIPFAIDPEALLLATLRFAMDESRFRGEVLAWLSTNGELISVQRVKNVQLNTKLAPKAQLRSLASFMQQAGYRSWKTLADPKRPNGAFAECFGEEMRGMSQAPDCERRENFILRMRLVFGVNARAEVITWLLTHRAGHAARIARDTAWFSKSVQTILNDLEKAGIVIAQPVGKRKEYAMNPRSTIWHPSFAKGLQWLSQGHFYLGLHYALETLEKLESRPLSPKAAAITIRQLLPSMAAAFHLAGQDDLYAAGLFERGDSLTEHFTQDSEKLIRRLREPRRLRQQAEASR